MNEYPKKEEYNVIKRLSKKNRYSIGKSEEFLDFRFKHDEPERLQYGQYFIPLLKYYNIIDLNIHSFLYGFQNFSIFISQNRKELLELKNVLDIKDFYSYRYQDYSRACCDDLAGILFKNTQQKMIFILKHPEIIDIVRP